MTKYTVVYTQEAEGGFSGRCFELPGAPFDHVVNCIFHDFRKSVWNEIFFYLRETTTH
jgi:hypothetical protein